MTPRERVLTALNHQEPDRVPIDLGGTFATSINVGAYERLKAHLGLATETRVASLRSAIPEVEEEVLVRFGVDTRGVQPGAPERSQFEPYPDGSYRDEWGVVRAQPAGGGHYIDTGNPFAGEPNRADPSTSLRAGLDRHRWPDPDDPGFTRGVAEAAQRLHTETDYAVILSLPVGIVHQAQWLRGFQDWLTDPYLNPDFFTALLERTCEVWLGLAQNLLKAAGEYVDVVFYGDDVAIQNGPLLAPEMYRKFVKPWHQKVFDGIRAYTQARILYHSCGSVYSLIPDLIDLGIDALNPVQVSAAQMGDTAHLKREFGGRLAFWGGIDTHRVLPRGTPEEVREEVRRRIRDLAPGGGYVLNSVHNIQREVPPENVVALFEAAQEYGVY